MNYFSIWCAIKHEDLSERVLSYIDNKSSILDNWVLLVDDYVYTYLKTKTSILESKYKRISDVLDDLEGTISPRIQRALRELVLSNPDNPNLVALVNRIDILKLVYGDWYNSAHLDLDIVVNEKANQLDLGDNLVLGTHGTMSMVHLMESRPMHVRIDAHFYYNGSDKKLSDVMADEIARRLDGPINEWSNFGTLMFSSDKFVKSSLNIKALNSYVTSAAGWGPMAAAAKGKKFIDYDYIWNEAPMAIGLHLYNGSQDLNKVLRNSLAETDRVKIRSINSNMDMSLFTPLIKQYGVRSHKSKVEELLFYSNPIPGAKYIESFENI